MRSHWVSGCITKAFRWPPSLHCRLWNIIKQPSFPLSSTTIIWIQSFRVPILKYRDWDGVQQNHKEVANTYWVLCLIIVFIACHYHLNEWLGGHLYKTAHPLCQNMDFKTAHYNHMCQMWLYDYVVQTSPMMVPAIVLFIKYGMLSKHPHHESYPCHHLQMLLWILIPWLHPIFTIVMEDYNGLDLILNLNYKFLGYFLVVMWQA